MKRIVIGLAITVLSSTVIFAQKDAPPLPVPPTSAQVAADNATAIQLAKAALAAHGGEKLKQMKSLVMKGSADINVSNQVQPGGFSTAISGSKYYFEISTQLQSFKQVFDGQNTSSTLPGILLPPVTSVGFPVLAHVGEAGYLVTKYGGLKKKPGFRITTPDGFYTDFWVDEKSGEVKGYESSYLAYGRDITTSAEIESTQNVEGVILPKKYSQRFDLGSFTAYASFNMKDIRVNVPVDESAFTLK